MPGGVNWMTERSTPSGTRREYLIDFLKSDKTIDRLCIAKEGRVPVGADTIASRSASAGTGRIILVRVLSVKEGMVPVGVDGMAERPAPPGTGRFNSMDFITPDEDIVCLSMSQPRFCEIGFWFRLLASVFGYFR